MANLVLCVSLVINGGQNLLPMIGLTELANIGRAPCPPPSRINIETNILMLLFNSEIFHFQNRCPDQALALALALAATATKIPSQGQPEPAEA